MNSLATHGVYAFLDIKKRPAIIPSLTPLQESYNIILAILKQKVSEAPNEKYIITNLPSYFSSLPFNSYFAMCRVFATKADNYTAYTDIPAVADEKLPKPFKEISVQLDDKVMDNILKPSNSNNTDVNKNSNQTGIIEGNFSEMMKRLGLPPSLETTTFALNDQLRKTRQKFEATQQQIQLVERQKLAIEETQKEQEKLQKDLNELTDKMATAEKQLELLFEQQKNGNGDSNENNNGT